MVHTWKTMTWTFSVVSNGLHEYIYMLLFKLDNKDKISNYCVMNGSNTNLWDPPLNKFEQISSDGHQMLLAEGWGQGVPHVSCTGTGPRGSHVCCPGFRARARGWSHVWCPVGYPAQWGPTIYHGQWSHGTPSPRWLTDTTENISFQ